MPDARAEVDALFERYEPGSAVRLRSFLAQVPPLPAAAGHRRRCTAVETPFDARCIGHTLSALAWAPCGHRR